MMQSRGNINVPSIARAAFYRLMKYRSPESYCGKRTLNKKVDIQSGNQLDLD